MSRESGLKVPVASAASIYGASSAWAGNGAGRDAGGRRQFRIRGRKFRQSVKCSDLGPAPSVLRVPRRPGPLANPRLPLVSCRRGDPKADHGGLDPCGRLRIARALRVTAGGFRRPRADPFECGCGRQLLSLSVVARRGAGDPPADPVRPRVRRSAAVVPDVRPRASASTPGSRAAFRCPLPASPLELVEPLRPWHWFPRPGAH